MRLNHERTSEQVRLPLVQGVVITAGSYMCLLLCLHIKSWQAQAQQCAQQL